MKAILFPVILVALGLGTLVCIVRLLVGPDTGTRLCALNALSALVLGFLLTLAVMESKMVYLDVALVYAIFGFLGFLAIDRFKKPGAGEGGGQS